MIYAKEIKIEYIWLLIWILEVAKEKYEKIYEHEK